MTTTHPSRARSRRPALFFSAVCLLAAIGAPTIASALCGDALDAPRLPEPRLSFGERTLVLTFDAAWTTDGAEEILDTLAARGVRGTFFLCGRFIRLRPDLVRRIVAEGHEVGNHTFRHDHLTHAIEGVRMTLPGVTAERLAAEMEATRIAFAETTGRALAPLWRAPYGETNAEIVEWAREAGYTHVGWSDGLDALDWVNDPASRLYRTPAETVGHLLDRLAARPPGSRPAVLLLHLGSERPPGERFGEALPLLLDGAARLGYGFVTAGEAAGEGDLP